MYLSIHFRTKNGSQGSTGSPSNNLTDPDTIKVDDSMKNSLFPAAHSVVKFHYQPHRGRFAVADQDIEVKTFLLPCFI